MLADSARVALSRRTVRLVLGELLAQVRPLLSKPPSVCADDLSVGVHGDVRVDDARRALMERACDDLLEVVPDEVVGGGEAAAHAAEHLLQVVLARARVLGLGAAAAAEGEEDRVCSVVRARAGIRRARILRD